MGKLSKLNIISKSNSGLNCVHKIVSYANEAKFSTLVSQLLLNQKLMPNTQQTVQKYEAQLVLEYLL